MWKTAACSLFLLLVLMGWAQNPAKPPAPPNGPTVCEECIRKNLEFLASDELRGRGSGTEDEHKAAEYVGSQLKAYGVQPAGGDGAFVQQAALERRVIGSPPVIKVGAAGSERTLVFGKDFLAVYLSNTRFSGPLQKVDSDKMLPALKPGAFVLVTGTDLGRTRHMAFSLFSSGINAAMVEADDSTPEHFAARALKMPRLSPKLMSRTQGGLATSFNALELSHEVLQALAGLPEGTVLQFEATTSEEKSFTWNAVGILPGSDPALRHAAVLFSAHLDHLGVGKPVNGDSIYNGADDDASGTVAVLELARALGAGPKPKRTVIFALFGSEETGGLGSTYFRENPPVPLTEIAANLEFEMIGRPDAAVKADTLWLTGWERSNLGPVLAEHGAHLVADPHPEQDFFARSDNYVLAKKGVVAQTISSFGLHADYHQPSDDIAHIDFKHMDEAIGSLLAPVEWLVNSDFTPKWNQGGQP
jgi:hypothetical protein